MVENSIHEKAMLPMNGERGEFVTRIAYAFAVSGLVGLQAQFGEIVIHCLKLNIPNLKRKVATELYPGLSIHRALNNTGSVLDNFNNKVNPNGVTITQTLFPTTLVPELIDPQEQVRIQVDEKIQERPIKVMIPTQMVADIPVQIKGEHIHSWRIETPDGPFSDGVCKCGEHRVFQNSLSEEQINPNLTFNRNPRR